MPTATELDAFIAQLARTVDDSERREWLRAEVSARCTEDGRFMRRLACELSQNGVPYTDIEGLVDAMAALLTGVLRDEMMSGCADFYDPEGAQR